MSAGTALRRAAMAALGGIEGMRVYDAAPAQAALPFATIEVGPQTDWGHKSGAGREVRLAVTIWDKGATADRLGGLTAAVEERLADLGGDVVTPGAPPQEEWRLVTMRLTRSRTVNDPRGSGPSGPGPAWVSVVEFRARMLARP